MKTAIRTFIVASLLSTMSLAFASNPSFLPPQPEAEVAQSSTPIVILEKTALSPEELARYELKAEEAADLTGDAAAGAASNRTVWIVVGVVAVVLLIALAAGGGGSSY